MRKIDESAFNASLSKKIKALSESVTQLTPENFAAISERYIELNRKLEERNWSFDDSAMINSVDSYKINRMLIYARGCPRDYLYQRINNPLVLTGSDVALARKKKTSFKKSYRHRVPKGFTGVNSFVLPLGWFNDISDYPPLSLSVAKGSGYEETRLRYTRNMDTIVFEWEGKIFVNWMDEGNAALFQFAGRYNFIDILYWR